MALTLVMAEVDKFPMVCRRTSDSAQRRPCGLSTDARIRPLSAIGIRTFRTATYRHVGDATSRPQNASDSDRSRGAAVHVATPGVADRARLKLLLDTLCGLPQPVWATSLELTR